MARYKKSSLQMLKDRIDLYEVLSSYLEFKKVGRMYKALCPFHDEKTPSFILQQGDTHYHCFGCNVHGDAIQFLMQHQHLSFVEAIEHLAEKYQIHLEKTEERQQDGVDLVPLKEAMEKAKLFYHTVLMRTQEGKKALTYLHQRGLSDEYIQQFQIGFAPSKQELFCKVMHEQQISNATLELCGLLSNSREFFQNRIMFPVLDRMGGCIAFSGRKIDEKTFGGKYINTKATSLFKKSKVLFGLYESKKRMAKEKMAILVEGQLDCLTLIYHGLDCCVATLGTAFGLDHVEVLKKLGCQTVYLAMDSDSAGIKAAILAGDLLQKKSIQVRWIALPKGEDPHSFVHKHSIKAFLDRLKNAISYLDFLCRYFALEKQLDDPTKKSQSIQEMAQMIKKWEDPLHVHESLKILSQKFNVPYEMLSDTSTVQIIKKKHRGIESMQSDDVIEQDLFYWILYADDAKKQFLHLAKLNLTSAHFKSASSKVLFEHLMKVEKSSLLDLMQIEELQAFIETISKKKVKREKAKELFTHTVRLLLNRKWLHDREEIKIQIQNGNLDEVQVLQLAKAFDQIKNSPPKLKEVEHAVS